jgi:hypothetical protein
MYPPLSHAGADPVRAMSERVKVGLLLGQGRCLKVMLQTCVMKKVWLKLMGVKCVQTGRKEPNQHEREFFYITIIFKGKLHNLMVMVSFGEV